MAEGTLVGAPTFVGPQQILDFSYTPRINEALENREEVDQAWRDLEIMSQGSSDRSEEANSEGEGTTDSQTMETDGD